MTGTGASPVVSGGSSDSSDPSSARGRKDSRGYSFHYSPVDISNPLSYGSNSPSYSSSGFHNRMGMDSKMATYGAKRPATSFNSFNIHESMGNANSGSTSAGKKQHSFVLKKTNHGMSLKTSSGNNNKKYHSSSPRLVVNVTTTQGPEIETSNEVSTTKNPLASVLSSLQFASGVQNGPHKGMDMSKILGEGLNLAMSGMITGKLTSMLDQEIPVGIVKPLQHIVASGNSMIQFWDKRADARDGKTPGMIELLAYGIDKLKKMRDGNAIEGDDPVANLTSPSKIMMQGLVTIRKLTNRVVGYEGSLGMGSGLTGLLTNSILGSGSSNTNTKIQSRDGYGGGWGGWGWGQQSHG